MDILTVSRLDKAFGARQVLHGLCLSVPEHSIYGFVGRNGAGKTTTMRCILGLERPDAGEILVGGERVVYGASAANRMVGYLPDVPEFYDFLTPVEYLVLCGEISGLRGSALRKRCAEMLELVGLGGERRRIRGFSRGMKQRLGIAQALLGRPRLLICDEPTSALDPLGRREMLDLLLAAREETTVLFSTHILSDVERVCDEVALLHDGCVAMTGDVSALRSRGRGGCIIELEQQKDAQLLTTRLPGVRQEGALLLRCPKEMPMSVVYTALAEAGVEARRVEREERTLEEIFFEVTGA